MLRSVLPAIVVLPFIVAACAGESTPVLPQQAAHAVPQTSQTHLWGFYDVLIDPQSLNVQWISNRQAMFTANVVNLLNPKPAGLSFKINGTSPGPDYIDIDIDVTILHPFPGLHQYDGYDVRGVFMGDGSGVLSYNSSLKYAVRGTDQFMFADPVDGFGGPDGYTRWFNKPEFSMGGMPLFQYTQGKYATQGFNGTATLNPFRYYADGLGATEDLWTWLNSNASKRGVFSAGSSNKRNYYLRFPNSKGVRYGYAITANWSGEGPEYHPSNAPEAVAVKVTDTSDVWYVSPSQKGGNLKLDISVWDWDSQISGGVMEDYRIIIESTVLSSPHYCGTPEMTPIGGGEHFSTYHVEIPADNVQGTSGNEFWVIVECDDETYANDFGSHNLAENDLLAACFRYDLAVSSSPLNQAPVCDLKIDPSTPVPATGLSPVPVKFDASGSYDPDGDPLTFAWDFNGDGTYGGTGDEYKGTPDKPTHGYINDYTGKVYVKVSDSGGKESVCSVDVSVDAIPSKNLPLRSGVTAYDLALESGDGDLTILYSDDWVYKYLASEYYQTGYPKYSKLYNMWAAPQFHECDSAGRTGNGGYVTVGSPPWSAPQVFYYKPEAASPSDYISLWSMQFVEPMPPNKYFDLINFGPNGSYANDMGGVYGYDYGGAHWIRLFRHRYSGSYFNFMGWSVYSFTGSVLTGQDRLYWEYVAGVTTDKTGDYLWFVENTDFYASRWLVSGSSITYNNAYFGTGSQGDADNSWNNAKDITRDNQNRLFVLDKLSTGQARVKMWTVSGNTASSKGGFGDSSTICGEPLRIEGGDFSGNIFVLHGSPAAGYFLSIFTPFEMPE